MNYATADVLLAIVYRLAAFEENLFECTVHIFIQQGRSLYVILQRSGSDNIAVFPDYRKNGLGKALTIKLIETAEEKNCAFISLEVRPSNTAAVHMYKKLGFEIVGKRKNFYRGNL